MARRGQDAGGEGDLNACRDGHRLIAKRHLKEHIYRWVTRKGSTKRWCATEIGSQRSRMLFAIVKRLKRGEFRRIATLDKAESLDSPQVSIPLRPAARAQAQVIPEVCGHSHRKPSACPVERSALYSQVVQRISDPG